MTVDWTHFTPLNATLGGIFIGIATALLIIFNGRIAGISGILGGILPPKYRDFGWRIAFILGLLIAFWCLSPFLSLPPTIVNTNTFILMLAGLLVGFGTRLGSGCTSGHGICGLARYAPRSIIATLIFMISGATTVFITRHAFS